MSAETADNAAPAPKPAAARAGRPVGAWRMPLLVRIAAAILVLVSLVALLAPLLTPYGYEETDLLYRLKPPFWSSLSIEGHLLGTDKLGRDLLSRLLIATQVSLALALLGTLIGAVLGTFLGILAAHRGGWVDEVVMMLVDWQAAMPFLIIALAVLAFLGNNFYLFLALMGLAGWETYARLTRSLVLSAREQGYAVAVRALGARPLRLYGRHILPNVMGPLIVQLTLNFPQTILLETSLSFLGLGIQPPLTSLGQMLGDGRDYLLTAWWLAVLPGGVIFLTTLSMSLFGDWLRTRLDPTQR
ncbi:ABC transporter permease [Thalassobaculum litoreum]|uniref:Peptide/nickel transport system permease protein n=1 Tax=Thalassobaculum litoreum DSM 18839 TaxID=1123362 RepID=A0A8G2EZA7_9PROT|nr:ABC transporter permease [Thalassobaculum litoreum]SDG15721.1 peptide/nickel transport system permease protein [Thalassobaculum litoreum DSM 18839]